LSKFVSIAAYSLKKAIAFVHICSTSWSKLALTTVFSLVSLFGCDLDQVNVVPNDNGTFFDLMFINAPVSVVCADAPVLKLGRHHRAYEIEMREDVQDG
jgi:hypothetical protein